MSNLDKKNVHRWVLLKHIGSPDDIKGIHFDLLLEDKDLCRTWRLTEIPLLDGPYVDSVCIAPHHLYWLDIEKKVVSDNRGVATRIKRGIFLQSLPSIANSFINLSIEWEGVESHLVMDKYGCRIFRKRY